MHRGHIKIWRKIVDWEWIDDPNTLCLFIHLNLLANWKDKNWRGIQIKRGELITSLSKLSKKTGLSIQNIRTSLDHLKSTQEVTQFQHNNYTHISIKNYDIYQKDNTISNKELTYDQQLLKKEKKDNIYSINEKIIFSYFENKNLDNPKIVELATKYDIRPKDVVYCLEDMLSKSSEKDVEIKNVEAKINKWINNSIRWHYVKTLTAKNQEEKEKSKPKLTEEDKWIIQMKKAGRFIN